MTPRNEGSSLHHRMRELVRHSVIGVVTGFVILGLGGRVIMVLTSWLFALPVGLTVRGTFIVAVTGAIYGALGGACYAFFARRLPPSRLTHALVLGTGLFVVIGVVSTLNNQTGPAWLNPGLTITLFLPLAWVWAAVAVRIGAGYRT